MSALTWAELSHRKIGYVCTHGIDRWEYCRAIASHLRLQQEIEQWMIAAFIGTAFLLMSVAATILLAGRRQRAATPAREPRTRRASITLAGRRWRCQPAPAEPVLA